MADQCSLVTVFNDNPANIILFGTTVTPAALPAGGGNATVTAALMNNGGATGTVHVSPVLDGVARTGSSFIVPPGAGSVDVSFVIPVPGGSPYTHQICLVCDTCAQP